ncbi:MAG TPA: hypothetical protein VMR50_15135 [Myxococcota bacterium]|nr:hypothetical protein [Myxococcota bacterium]
MACALAAFVAGPPWLTAAADPSSEVPASAETAPESEFELGFRGTGAWAPIDGYVQVPLGGNPGSSSSRRPTLKELGISDAGLYELELHFRWDHLVFFGGYSGLGLDSSGTLSQPLVSHGVSFDAGSPFKSSIDLNVGNFGAGYRFDFDGGRLRLMPRIDAAVLDFSYALDSGASRAARDYRVTAMRLGLDGSWALGRGFSLELDGVASVPVPHWPQLASVTGRVAWTAPLQGAVRVGLFLGTGARWIDFEDSQTLPNHIHVTAGPLVLGGITIAY